MEKTFNFLKKLAKNNRKEWFDAHKEEYLEAKEEFEKYVDTVISGIKKFDKKIDPLLSAKQCSFRIYRDVRFSKNKAPYKNNMGASINPGGKKSLEAGYYLHFEPGKCFLAGGVYMPEPEMLQAIRQEIDYNAKALHKILKAPGFKKYFKGLDEEDKMVSAPKGYAKDHPEIELLKNRHFLVSCELTDKQINTKGSEKKIVEIFKAMHPLMIYLREATHK
jgi:uncharacterized protein (TIGR02453 family)